MLVDPVLVDISLPGGGSWQAAAVPAGGWHTHVHAGAILATRLIGLLLTMVIAALTYSVTRSTLELRATSEELRDSQALFAGFMANLPAGKGGDPAEEGGADVPAEAHRRAGPQVHRGDHLGVGGSGEAQRVAIGG